MIISAFSDGITAIERGGVHFPIALTRTASGNQFFPSFGLLEVFNRLRIYNYLFHFIFLLFILSFLFFFILISFIKWAVGTAHKNTESIRKYIEIM